MGYSIYIQRLIYPKTNTPDEAWKTAANSVYAGIILSLNRLMFGTVLLSATPAIGPSLVQLGIGFLYILLAWLAHRRSRIACGFILLLSFFEVLIEVVLVIIIQGNYGFNFIIVLVAFILSYGGFRGANAIFTHYRNTHK
ncbi:MAG: hypothetical protein CMM38_07715 [Rhodospirillaceae bacterium]|nr:hypothetical protein [Rhodospirillaceae bacterium]